MLEGSGMDRKVGEYIYTKGKKSGEKGNHNIMLTIHNNKLNIFI
jgi:hypothetical protein